MMNKPKRNPKGVGSFKYNNNGSVTHTKSVGFLPGGGRRVLTVTASSRAECVRLMRKREQELEKTASNLDRNVTLTELCNMHLEYQVKNRELSNKSQDRRETTINRHLDDYELGHLPATMVTSADVEDHITRLISEQRLSASSIRKVLDVVNAAFTWAVNRGDLKENPVSPIKRTLMKRLSNMTCKDIDSADVIVLSKSEQNKYLRYVTESMSNSLLRGELHGLYGLLLLQTGLRVGELNACKWKDYDPVVGVLTISKSIAVVKNRQKLESGSKYVKITKSTKNQKARRIELYDDAKSTIELIKKYSRWTNKDDYISATRRGTANTATNLEHRIRKVFRDAGIFTGDSETGSLHIFRRTFATDCYYNRHMPLKTIAAYLGDMPDTIMKYYIAARDKTVSADGEVQQIVRISDYSS